MQSLTRVSLPTQVAAALRQELKASTWQHVMPGEHVLCNHLGVSRPTLREALSVLEREGLIQTVRGSRRRIIAKADALSRVAQPKIVGMLLPAVNHASSNLRHYQTSELWQHLRAADYTLEVHPDPSLYSSRPDRKLEKLIQMNPARCWILCGAPRAVQKWFFDRKIPTLVVGSCHSGIRLPSIDIDYRGVCRHAAQVLARFGHRSVAMLIKDSGAAGDLASEEGFIAGCAAAELDPGSVIIARHDRSLAGIRAAVDRLMSQADRPTALLVTLASETVTVASHLMNAGVRIPQDLSLICRDDDVNLSDLVPEVARYTYNRVSLVRRRVRLALRLAQTGYLPPRPTLIIPDFRPGQTLARRPAKAL